MTRPTIQNDMSLAKKGYRGVSVPVNQEGIHQVETAALAGYLTLMRLKSNDPSVTPLMHSPRFRACLESMQNHGKITFQELYPEFDDDSNEEDPDLLETFRHHYAEYTRQLCGIGCIACGSKFEKDYWPCSALVKEGQVVQRATEVAEMYRTSMSREWPSSLTQHDFDQIGRCAIKMALEQWDSDNVAFILCTKLFSNVCARIHEWNDLEHTDRQDPRNQTVLNLVYAAAFHKQGLTLLIEAQPQRQRRSEAFFEKIKNVSMAIMDNYAYHTDMEGTPRFRAVIERRRQLVSMLSRAVPFLDEIDLPAVQETIHDLKTKIRPHALVSFDTVIGEWDKIIAGANMLCTMYSTYGFPGHEVQFPTSESSSSASSAESSPESQRRREQRRRDAEEREKQRRMEQEAAAQKRREEEELQAAKQKREDEQRAEQKRIEDELRAAKKKKEEEEWEAQQKKLEEKRTMQRKLEQEAKAAKKKQEQERIQKLIEERNRAKRAEDEKRAKERAEREERERVEQERAQRERAEREEQDRIGRERIQRERAERDEQQRIQNQKLNDAQNAILETIARDPTKLDPKFILKFMQTYAPSLVRFARFEEDEETIDPLIGSCQICFDAFNTTPQKKPFYLKCCAQSLCAGCLQKVLNKPHRTHRLEFDEDDTLVRQWVVMRRALGLQVPEY